MKNILYLIGLLVCVACGLVHRISDTKTVVNVGTNPNDGTGDPLRTAFIKINTEFQKYADDSAKLVHFADTVTGGKIATKAEAGMYNVLNYGAKGDGTTDDAAAIRATITAAGPNGKVYFPTLSYKVNSTIPISTGQTIEGNNSTILSDITNGTAVFEMSPFIYWATLQNFTITTHNNVWHNCIGILIGESLSNEAYYNNIKNIRVKYCHIGYSVIGWGNIFDNIHTYMNGTGFIGSELGATSINNMWFSRDSLEFNIKSGSGININNARFEGIFDWKPSRIDNSSNFSFNGVYIENSELTDSSMLYVGYKGPVEHLYINNWYCGISTDYAIPFIQFDSVDYVEIGGTFKYGAFNSPFHTTKNTTNFKTNNLLVADGKIHDNQKLLGQFYNYFPNSSFEMYLRGFNGIALTRVTLSQKTDTVKSGKSALRITSTGGAGIGEAEIDLTDNISTYQGKKLRFGIWVYVPEIDDYINNASRVILPKVVLYKKVGGSTYGSSLNRNYMTAGQWNFLSDTLNIENTASEVFMGIYINYAGSSPDVGTFLIVDDIIITDVGCSTDRLINSTLPEYPGLSARNIGGMMILRADAVPTDTHQIYIDGDQVWKKTTVAGQFPGWICTTGGIGGTAAWAPMAVLGTP